MGNLFNPDFRDFLKSFNDCEVEYLLVGGYAVILHGYGRTTGDMDIWVNRTKENYSKIIKAFHSFGMPLHDMTENNFLEHPTWDVFRYGRPPVAIDIMIRVKGLEFNESYKQAKTITVDQVSIKIVDIEDLILSKKASDRSKGKNDIENLT